MSDGYSKYTAEARWAGRLGVELHIPGAVHIIPVAVAVRLAHELLSVAGKEKPVDMEVAVNKSDRIVLLTTRVGVLEAENALLNKQRDAYENFIWAVLAMFSEKNMEAFNFWVTNILKAFGALPNADQIIEQINKAGANEEPK